MGCANLQEQAELYEIAKTPGKTGIVKIKILPN
jgi:hypothetical protein